MDGSHYNEEGPMRLPLISPSDHTSEQRPIYEDMRAGIEQHFQGFSSIAENGALIGSWNPWLHEPKFGRPIWEMIKALSFSPSLPKPVREVAILVTGAKLRAAVRPYNDSAFTALFGWALLPRIGHFTLNGFDVPVPEAHAT